MEGIGYHWTWPSSITPTLRSAECLPCCGLEKRCRARHLQMRRTRIENFRIYRTCFSISLILNNELFLLQIMRFHLTAAPFSGIMADGRLDENKRSLVRTPSRKGIMKLRVALHERWCDVKSEEPKDVHFSYKTTLNARLKGTFTMFSSCGQTRKCRY